MVATLRATTFYVTSLIAHAFNWLDVALTTERETSEALQCDYYLYRYCFTSCAISRKRTTFKPQELATTFISLQRKQAVEGLFLSSGFIHLKLMPGASFEYVERAVQLADPVSLNLEAPNVDRLAILAPDKEWTDNMWERLQWAADLIA